MPPGLPRSWRSTRPSLPVARLLNGRASSRTTTARLGANVQLKRPSASRDGCQPFPCTTTALRMSSTSAGTAQQPQAQQQQPDVVSWTTLTRDEEERARQAMAQAEDDGYLSRPPLASASSDSTLSPGDILIDSLRRDPVRLPPGVSTDASALSALVEPVVDYPHQKERFRSRQRHRDSVVRQARLEAIRQVQMRKLPDWREILRSLATWTPNQSPEAKPSSSLSLPAHLSPRALLDPSVTASDLSGGGPRLALSPHSSSPTAWLREAVSFVIPCNSQSIEELLHGVDQTLWTISGRTDCFLKLYREADPPAGPRATEAPAEAGAEQNKKTNQHRSWLLTLSGTEVSVNQATMELQRHFKDFVAVIDKPSAGPIILSNGDPRKPEETIAPSERRPEETAGAGHDSHGRENPHHKWQAVTSSHFLNDARARDPVFRPYILKHSANEIPRPSQWTPHSFERYVASLVNGRLPAHLARRLYPQPEQQQQQKSQQDKQQAQQPNQQATQALVSDTLGSTTASYSNHRIPNSHDYTVVNLLHGVFNEEAARPALSTAAFNRALAYMCERGETHRPDSRALFVRMEMFGLPVNTETFNVMLASQTKTQDLRNFGAIVNLMHDKGQTPDRQTWFLLLRMFPSEQVKRHILHAMHARGLLNSVAAVRRVAEEMAAHDAERAILEDEEARAKDAKSRETREPQRQREKGDPEGLAEPAEPADFVDRFLARQAVRYSGPTWLTRNVAHKVLEIWGRYGRFADCARLVEYMQQQPHPGVGMLDTVTFNILLTHCKVQNSVPKALAMVELMDRSPPSVAERPTVDARMAEQQQDADDAWGAQGSAGTTYISDLADLPTPAPAAIVRATPKANSVTYQLLFDLAWHRRLPHVLGVVWQYASAARLTSHWMRVRATQLLLGGFEASRRGKDGDSTKGQRMSRSTPPAALPSNTAHLVRVVRSPSSSAAAASSSSASSFLSAFSSALPSPFSSSSPAPKPSSPTSTHLGNLASTSIGDDFDGWEPAVPLSFALREAMYRDKALLQARFAKEGEPDPRPRQPLRIRMQRKPTDGKNQKQQSASLWDTPDKGDERYMEIQVDEVLPRKAWELPHLKK